MPESIAETFILTALKDYGVTGDKLTDLQKAIDNYARSVPKPRTVKANIRRYFKDADTILVEQIDKLVETFAEDFPDFVATYKSARVILDPKSKKKTNGTSAQNGSNTPT